MDTHTIKQGDIDIGSVSNIASAASGTTVLPSDTETVTVIPTSYSQVGQVINYMLVATKTPSNTPTTTPNETLTATPTRAGTLGTPTAMPTEALTIRVIELSTETPPETPTPTSDNTPTLKWTTEPPMPMDTPTSESAMLQPQEFTSPARQAQDSLLRAASMASSPSGGEPIINRGAYATWQYAAVEYRAVSNSVINGKRIFLPIIVKGAG